jgi:hypothetical protein
VVEALDLVVRKCLIIANKVTKNIHARRPEDGAAYALITLVVLFIYSHCAIEKCGNEPAAIARPHGERIMCPRCLLAFSRRVSKQELLLEIVIEALALKDLEEVLLETSDDGVVSGQTSW